MKAADPKAVRIIANRDVGLSSSYRVICDAIGAHALELNIGNQKAPWNPFPRVDTASAKLVCQHPASLVMSPRAEDLSLAVGRA